MSSSLLSLNENKRLFGGIHDDVSGVCRLPTTLSSENKVLILNNKCNINTCYQKLYFII